ncbi:MAG: DoxX family protein [Saprospiraceae bacterium]|nr:DoxX family protein [Saprospiraceae bacterium]
MLKKLLSIQLWSASATDTTALILRLSLGLLMLNHGYPKLMQFFNGEDIHFADPIFIGETASLVLTVFAEFFCSILIAIGLWTRLALIPLIVTMVVAVGIIHASDPMDKKEHGLLFLLPYLALFLLGSGKYSLDAVLQKKNA